MTHPFIEGYMNKEADWKDRLREVIYKHPAVAGAGLGGAFGVGVGLLPDEEVETTKDKLKNILIYGTVGAGTGGVYGGAIRGHLSNRKPLSVDFEQLPRDQQIKYLKRMQDINTGKTLEKAYPQIRELVR